MAKDQPFKASSKDLTSEFLQSVVVVDDQAFLHAGESAQALANTPSTRGASKATNLEAKEKAEEDLRTAKRQELNAKELIDAFAEHGLVCAVLRPQDRGDGGRTGLRRRTDHATQRADIVVLDWRIRKDETPGETALELVSTIIDTDSPQRDRLRLIAIYTGEPDLDKIGDQVEGHLSSNGRPHVSRTDYVLEQGPVRISLFAKSGVRTTNAAMAERVVPESDLPDRLIEEFAEMTTGLLANVAVASIGAIRKNTHRVLSKFGPHLDGAYVAHRALMVPSEEAEQHPLPLLASELLDLLEDCKVADAVSPQHIRKWLDWRIDDGLNLDGRITGMRGDKLKEALLLLVEKGTKEAAEAADDNGWRSFLKKLKESKKDALSSITNLLVSDGVPGTDRDLEFAMLMSLRSRYEAPPPMLMLGSIVAETVGEKVITEAIQFVRTES